MIISTLEKRKLISPPPWLKDNLSYLTIMGSEAYGCCTNTSDVDYYGFAIVPKQYFLPHQYGMIVGFDDLPVFEQWQQHGIVADDKKYDFQVFGITRVFKLLFDGNPNILDSIFTPRRCVVYTTPVGELIRENRHLFLSKRAFHKMKSYGFSQLKKLDSKNSKDVEEIYAFENEKNIPHDTTFAEIEEELKLRQI